MPRLIFSNYAYVYIMADNNGRHKIGVSVDPVMRVYQLKKTEKIDIRLIKWFPFTRRESLDIERTAHSYVVHRRDRRKIDWFFISEDEALAAVDRAIAACLAGGRVLPSSERLAIAAVTDTADIVPVPKEKTGRLNIELPLSLIKQIDNLRAQIPGIPNRSAVVRCLIEIALDTMQYDIDAKAEFRRRVAMLSSRRAPSDD